MGGKELWHLFFFKKKALLINKKAQFKVALKRYLITYTFYSVDEFLIFINKS
jgi:hypothetical protein